MKTLKSYVPHLSVGLVIVASAIVAVSRCSQPVCLGGIGVHGQDDCSGVPDGPTTQTGTFTLTVDKPSIPVGITATFLASGGTAGPYTYIIDPNSNPPPGSNAAGTINSTSGVYTAPATAALLGGVSPVTITIRATDQNGAYQTATVNVTSG